MEQVLDRLDQPKHHGDQEELQQLEEWQQMFQKPYLHQMFNPLDIRQDHLHLLLKVAVDSEGLQ